MNLSEPSGSVYQSHPCRPFEFSPTPRPKHAAESHDVPDPATDGYRFDPLDLTHNLEMHKSIVGSIGQGSNLLPVDKQ